MNGEIRIQTVQVTDVIVGINDMDGVFIRLILDEINRPSQSHIIWKLKFQLRYLGDTKIKKLMEYTGANMANLNSLKDKIFKIVAVLQPSFPGEIFGFGHYDFDKFTSMYTDSFDVTLSDLKELIRKM